MFYPRVRTKNSSAERLRKKYNTLPRFPFRSIIRLGSVTDTELIFPKSYGKKTIVELNTVEAIRNSRSKLRMKTCFANAEVPQANWVDEYIGDNELISDIKSVLSANLLYPILAKRIYGYKGRGMEKLDNQTELESWLRNHFSLEGWYFEKFHNYSREYRLHIAESGCFYTCRKMLKSDADNRWLRNDFNCIWVKEDNDLFDKPVNWKSIEEACVKGLKAVGLDIGAFDVKVQSATNRDGNKRNFPEFVVLEVNSAPSFGEITLEKYIENLPKILYEKYNKS